MKIYSRQHDQSNPMYFFGQGPHKLFLTEEQAELIAALICSCRLGQRKYSQAAYNILDMLEIELGSDWIEQANKNVDVQISVEDQNGNSVFKSISGTHFVTIEV